MPDVSDPVETPEDETPERAREGDGTYKPDDPETPEVNEAYVDGGGEPGTAEALEVTGPDKPVPAKPKAKKAKAKKGKSAVPDVAKPNKETSPAPGRTYHPHSSGAPLNPGIEKNLRRPEPVKINEKPR